MNENGWTLIELLAVLVILAIIFLITTSLILGVIKDARKGAFQNSAYGLLNSVENQYMLNQLKNKPVENVYEFSEGKLKTGSIEYKGEFPKMGLISIDEIGQVDLAITDGVWCALKSNFESKINILPYDVETCVINKEIPFKVVNAPLLTEGMELIKWDGFNEIVYNENDNGSWYDYENKLWANAKTIDGSYWVWIPRFAYQIETCYHSDCGGEAGIINIKFLQEDTNVAFDGTEADLMPIYNDDKQINYIVHPAFIFGEEQITGFWVAKFEPSGTENDISIKPNEVSLGKLSMKAQYNAALNMKNNSKYGWIGTEIDTHMMKNTEWGAVTYLSKSKYGANERIWNNAYKGYVTGCSGNSVRSSSEDSCIKYNTEKGVKASTTHNIYGVYDMSGGAWERVMGNLNGLISSHDGFTQEELNLIPKKHIDIYTSYSNVIFGDALYETSLNSTGSTSWYESRSKYIDSKYPWFHRGGNYITGEGAGLFCFYSSFAVSTSNDTFRPVVVN